MTTRNLTITIVTGPWFPTPPGPAGAVERVWGDLARHFARMGHRVTVLSRAFEGLPADETRDGVRTIRLTQWKQGSNVKLDLIKDVFFSTRMFLKCPRADIVVTNAFWLPAMLAAFKRSAGKVDMNVQRIPKGQMWLYRGVDRVSAVSKATADAIVREQPALAPRVRTIPNPIDLQYFRPPAQRNLDGTSSRGRTITFTGRIHPEKGLHLLVQAFRDLTTQFPDLKLRLIGPSAVDRGGGGEQYITRLRTLAGNSPMEIVPPIYDRTALSAALQEASYYCYPSLAEAGETFGVAPLEAGATGLAPIVSDLPAFREFLVPGVNGESFDHRASDPVAALTSALHRVICDPDRTRRMGEAAASTAQRFGYEQVASQYLADFYELLGGAPTASAAATGASA